jgi:DNA-directed RNA polymerase
LRDLVALEVAKTYRNIPFYLNTFADWRGRIYTFSFFLSYQSSDLSLSLINFYEGEILNERGIHYLSIYGANLYDENGMSKESY